MCEVVAWGEPHVREFTKAHGKLEIKDFGVKNFETHTCKVHEKYKVHVMKSMKN